jgi:hypothetical protein
MNDLILAWCIGLAVVSLIAAMITDKNDDNRPRK